MHTRDNTVDIDTDSDFVFDPIIIQDDFVDGAPRNTAHKYLEFEPYRDDYPAVYVLYSERKCSPEAYVGETAHLARRIHAHVKDRRRGGLDKVICIGCKAFNKSASYHMETRLISTLLADGRFVLQNVRQTSDGYTMHDYFRKTYFDSDLFPAIWRMLIEAGIAKSALNDLENSDVFKLSPYKQLSASQNELLRRVVAFCERHLDDEEPAVFLIKGEAGTGKSVVLSCLYKLLADLATDDKDLKFTRRKAYLLVNHSEQLKTYKEIARGIKGLCQNRFMKPTTFVNASMAGRIASDITIVDEGHLLLSQNDTFRSFKGENHLKEIIRHSRITVIVYDDRQVLKLKSYWDERKLNKILSSEVPSAKKRCQFRLTEQFRMHADQATISWIDTLVDKKKLDPLPPAFQGDESTRFEFSIFDDAERMYQTIRDRNDEWGLSRMVATFDYEHKKDGKVYYVEEGSFKLPWNIPTDDGTWAERDETIGEVGSIYTVQGFDLNFVGVILGPSISYDEKTDNIKVLPQHYKDSGAFKGRKDIPKSKIPAIKERIILNSLNVLMKRPIMGLFVYASDEALRTRLMELQNERDSLE